MLSILVKILSFQENNSHAFSSVSDRRENVRKLPGLFYESQHLSNHLKMTAHTYKKAVNQSYL